MTRKAIVYTVLALAIGLGIASYADEEKTAPVSSSEGIPETISLDRVVKMYEPVPFSHEMHAAIAEDCGDCHHHSGAGQTPSCGKCHSATLAAKESGTNTGGVRPSSR